MSKPVCLITGVGPGTGKALAQRFSRDYEVAMLARNQSRLNELAEDQTGCHSFACDVANPEALATTHAEIVQRLGAPEIVIHNAVGGGWGDFLSIDPDLLSNNFAVNVQALLHLGRLTAPAMIAAGRGVIMATGNTAAYRGVANFAGFAPTKAAQRILLESMARRLGPDGVHVAFVAIDAVIDLKWTRKRFADKPDDFFCQPADIAEHCFSVAQQPRSAWTFDTKIRPFGETW
ncbi:MAG: SDR family NAD(P)-dependent oxidoreductase [Pseudomonadales bacterium]